MVKVGVVGCGYWGPNLIRNLVENRRCEGVVVCDLEQSRLDYVRQRFPVIGTTLDIQEILDDPAIPAVVIATPLSTHFDLARRALGAGKHVFVEKPFAHTSVQAQALIDLAKASGKVIMVGHTFEYSPAVRKIGEVIRSGELGDVYYISSTRVNLGLHQKDVSVVWDLAPHDLSMIFAWLGEHPVQVVAVDGTTSSPGFPTWLSSTSSSVPASWPTSRCRGSLPPSPKHTIVGSRKMLVYDDTEHL